MSVLGIDLGGTKIASAVFTDSGKILKREEILLGNRKGADVGLLISKQLKKYLHETKEDRVKSVGVSVPGISYAESGTVWAPNISGWDNYPLLEELKAAAGAVPVIIDNDRACYILGELWQGKAQGARNAIFLAVGTGIGAGILVNGAILRGAHDIAGAIGWMALGRPYESKYISCGCFEYHASGEGIVKVAFEVLDGKKNYNGELKRKPQSEITAADIFEAFENKDSVAVQVIEQCVEFWGMAAANLISIFNPEKVLFGGGVFGPGKRLITAIKKEAGKWAQPVSFKQVGLEAAGLGKDAGVYGAGFIALKHIHSIS